VVIFEEVLILTFPHSGLKQVMSLFTLGSTRAVLVVALAYSFPDVFNVIMALMLFKVILYSNGCAAEIAKTPQCIYCYQMKPEFTCYNLFDNLDAIGYSERMNFNVIDKKNN
jgi:hypothetical protein